MTKTIHSNRPIRAVLLLLVAMLMSLSAWAQSSNLVVLETKPTSVTGLASKWGNGKESFDKLVDGNTSTKYGIGAEATQEPYVEFSYADAFVPKGYKLWTAADIESYTNRNPKSWTLLAKLKENDSWTTLASVDNSNNDKLPIKNTVGTEFLLNNSNAYKYFRFVIVRRTSNNLREFQLAELQFLVAPNNGSQEGSLITETPTFDAWCTTTWGTNGSENHEKLFDGKHETKYGVGHESTVEPFVEFHYAKAYILKGYTLWTGNDNSNGGRNPKSWKLLAKAKKNDTSWITLASVDNSDGSKLPKTNTTKAEFTLNNNTAYQYYRFEAVRGMNGQDKQFELGELELYGVESNETPSGGDDPSTPTIVDGAYDLSSISTEYTAKDGDVFTGVAGQDFRLFVKAGATVTLKNVNMTQTAANHYGISCIGNAKIILKGTNVVKGGSNSKSGIYVTEGNTLTIEGDGSLDVSAIKGAGIGCGWQMESCGNIIINSGTITATGGQYSAGIGSSFNIKCGAITINGGTVTAIGGSDAAGIGCGRDGECGKVTINKGIAKVTAIKGGDNAQKSIGIGSGSCSFGGISIAGEDNTNTTVSPYVLMGIIETNFPDNSFRNFLLSQTYGADEFLNSTEIAAITTLDVQDKSISSLKGIEHFTSLSNLDCRSNSMKEAAMLELVNSLPTVTNGTFCVVNTNMTDKDNTCLPEHVKIAKDKGWRVVSKNGSTLTDYEGLAPVTKYPVAVYGVEVTEENANDVLGDGSVSYTPGEGVGTLTFKSSPTSTVAYNPSISSHDIDLTVNAPQSGLSLKNGIDVTSSKKLTVNGNLTIENGTIPISCSDFTINGNLNQTSTNPCVSANGNIKLNGTSHKLTAQYGYALQGDSITIIGNVVATSQNSDVISSSVGGLTIKGNAELTTTGGSAINVNRDINITGDVKATGKNHGICTRGNVTINGDVTATSDMMGIYSSNGGVIINGNATVTGKVSGISATNSNITLNGTKHEVIGGNQPDIWAKTINVKGDITAKATNNPTFSASENVTIEGNVKAEGIVCFSVTKDVTIKGNVTATATSGQCFYCENLTITGNVTATSKVPVFVISKSITIDGDVTATSDSRPVINGYGDVNIVSGTWTLETKDTSSPAISIYYGGGKINIPEGYEISEPEGGKLNTNSTSIVNTDGSPASRVVIAKPQGYPVWVGETQVTKKNASDILGDGNVSYTPGNGSGTLTFKKAATITSMHNGASIYVDGIDLTIKANKGLNLNNSSMGINMNGNKKLTVNGNVNMTCSSPCLSATTVVLNGTNHELHSSSPCISAVTITITGDLTASSQNCPAIAATGDITLVSGTWTLDAGDYSAISTENGKIIIPATHEIWEPEGAQFIKNSRGNTIIADANGNMAGHVVIAPKKQVAAYTAPTAKQKLVYSGKAQQLIVAGSSNEGEMQYSADNKTWSTNIPTATEAGDYTVYYKVVADKNHKDAEAQSLTVTIAKADVTVTAPTAKQKLVYSGKAQVLIEAGSAQGGEMQYSADNKTWSTNIPTATEAGDYTVYYKVVADKNHKDVEAQSLTVTIAKADVTMTAPTAKEDLVEDGSALTLIEAGSAEGGEMQYSLDGNTWSTDIPTATEAGDYTVYYKVVADKNHKDVKAQSLTVTIAMPSGVRALTIGEGTDNWYDLKGHKLDSKPAKKGLYIYKGKKVKR